MGGVDLDLDDCALFFSPLSRRSSGMTEVIFPLRRFVWRIESPPFFFLSFGHSLSFSSSSSLLRAAWRFLGKGKKAWVGMIARRYPIPVVWS